MKRARLLRVVLTAVLLPGAAAPAVAASTRQTPAPSVSQPPTGPGRVVATVTALDGQMRMSGVDVELRAAEGDFTIARTATDGAGQVIFADIPEGRYLLIATRPGLADTESAPFAVHANEQVELTLEASLTFVLPDVEVTAAVAPSTRMQPVSTRDMLSGAVLDQAPLQGDDFQSLLPLLPGVVRGPDGRLRAKGGQPVQGALQISSTSLVDPSTGDFDVQLPGQSLESVQLLANPFAAEHGRFSTSLVQIRTRRGTNDWDTELGNLMPRVRSGLSIRGFEPRASVRGPLLRDRIFFAQDLQLRYVSDAVKSLPDEPEIVLRSVDTFTRVDSALSYRHSLGGLLVAFPREIDRLSLDTFRPPEVTPELSQRGASLGIQDRFAWSSAVVLETTIAARRFDVDIDTDGRLPMVYTPLVQRGSFFNDQRREVRSIQWVEALSLTVDRWPGQHLFKVGFDHQQSGYEGTSSSRPVEVRRLDNTLAERTEFGPASTQDVTAAEFSFFAQDRWRIGSRFTLEAGIRSDREDLIRKVSWSPRAGAAIAVLSEGRGILRGGIGWYLQRTPLNVGAYPQFEPRLVTRFDAAGTPLGPAITFANRIAPTLRTPGAVATNVEWNQRFTRRWLLKANYLDRRGSREYILEPDGARGVIELTSNGTSRYRELELTTRYLGGDGRDLSVSYVRSRGRADTNAYDQYFGNVRLPIIRPNEYTLIPTDAPHRLLVRGVLALPGRLEFAPVLEVRSGFPYSAVDEFQDFVGLRNRAGRLPALSTLDFSLTRPWRLFKWRFRAGVRVYNLLGTTNERDVQSNTTSPEFGRFFNPIERSIGITFGRSR